MVFLRNLQQNSPIIGKTAFIPRSVSAGGFAATRTGHRKTLLRLLSSIPLSIVQSIVGHMTPEMTKHYSAHASLSAKREQMRQLPEFMMLTGLETRDDESADREELHRLISTLPIEKVRELLEELR